MIDASTRHSELHRDRGRWTSADAQRRAAAFERAFAAHLTKMRNEPGAYGELGLADVFEMREECLREFGFTDVYRCGGPCHRATFLHADLHAFACLGMGRQEIRMARHWRSSPSACPVSARSAAARKQPEKTIADALGRPN